MAVRLPWCCRRKATVFLTSGAQRCGGRPCSRPLHSGSYVKSTSVAGSDSSAPPKPSPKPLQEMPGMSQNLRLLWVACKPDSLTKVCW